MTLQKLIILMRSKLIIQLHYLLGRSSSDILRPFWHCNFLFIKATILSNAIISREGKKDTELARPMLGTAAQLHHNISLRCQLSVK